MSPICATFHRSCQSCKITRTAEHAQTASLAKIASLANPAPRSGRRKASLRDQNPGSEKKRGSDPAKKRASNQPAFRMRLPRYRPQAAQPLPAAFGPPPGPACPKDPAGFDERPNLPKPKPPAPQSPCLQPRRSFPKAPEPCRSHPSQTALAQHFFTYGLEIRATILAA